MKLDPSTTIFNYSNSPWPVVMNAAMWGEWSPPGQAYTSNIHTIMMYSAATKIVRPTYLVLQTCQNVFGGGADFLLYAILPKIEMNLHPWDRSGCVKLTVGRQEDTGRHGIRPVWSLCSEAKIDELMALVGRATSAICFGVACKHDAGAKVRWHSAKMLSWTP